MMVPQNYVPFSLAENGQEICKGTMSFSIARNHLEGQKVNFCRYGNEFSRGALLTVS